MKNNQKYNKNKGFTLIEILMLIGVVSLVFIAIYTNFSRQAARQTALTQSVYLEQMSSNISKIFASSDSLTVLTPTNVIASRAVPQQMVTNPTTITNLFGGSIQFNDLGTTPPSYGIILSEVPRVSCGFLVTTGYASLAQSIIVNATALKAPGTVVTSATVAAGAAACDNDINTVEFRNPIERTNEVGFINPNPARYKEDPKYIPSIASNLTGPAPACTNALGLPNGTSWNGSFCGCPILQQWNGSDCVGFCAVGSLWNGSDCMLISPPYTAIASTPPANIIYIGGRYVPNVGYTGSVQQTPAQINNSCTAGGNFNGIYCEKCENGAWNGTKCVTP